MKLFRLILPALLFLVIPSLHASNKGDTLTTKDTLSKKMVPLKPYHRNVIKFNPTPMLLFGEMNNFTLNYERLVKNNQSVAVQVGYLTFPKVLADTVAHIINLKDGRKKGINLSVDYRYYPQLRNRRPAPDGLYLNAFISYYGFEWKNEFNIIINDTSVNITPKGDIKGNINILNVGLGLGYQFIFWKRFSLDMLLFGPSLSYYNRNITIAGELLSEDDKGEINQALVDKLLNRFPALGEIFSTDGLSANAHKADFGIGFRYSIMLGFHF